MASVQRHALTSYWTFREASSTSSHPATVPGCVHTDLLKNGLIPDPFFGINEQQLQWIGEKDWVYETTFDMPKSLLQHENVELVFKGLDTYATVSLNDSLVLSADNMFREWRKACKELLKEKRNHLVVRFRNVFDENLPKYNKAPFRLQAYANNDQADVKIAMYSRKAQFHYGWDWGPRLITCGIWRPVCLEGWSGVKIKNVHVQQQNVSTSGAEIISVFEILSTRNQRARLTATLDKVQLNSEMVDLHNGLNKVVVNGRIAQPKLWWTNGLGEQWLYSYRATAETEARQSDEYTTRIGVRSLEVVREKDSLGTTLFVLLNGVPVFMKGANYIPQDNFQNRVSAERYEFIIRSAAQANMNMLRVWGGGIYEEDTFYEMCDKYGVLIWHDLMFACAMYPADEGFLQNVKHEVIDNVSRIRNHASLALYCGNNENDISWHNWGWKKLYPPEIQHTYEQDHHKLFYEVIPSALKEADSTRYYHPSSPLAGFNNVASNAGDIHYWDVWHGKKPFESYLDNIARFVSEYGFQSYPELSTVKKFTEPADRELHSAVMLSHQRCMSDERRDKEYGNRLIQTYMEQHFNVPKDFESYLYVSQVLQAEGVKIAMEAHRRSMPFCMGSLYWQIDDCWPVASWSSIDCYGRWKALHYAARAAYAPVIISPVFTRDDVKFSLVSDRLESLAGTLDIIVQDFRGNEVFRHSIPVTVKPSTAGICTVLKKQDLRAGHDETQLVIVSSLKKGKDVIAENTSYFCAAKALRLERPQIASSFTKTKTGYIIELATTTLAKSVYLSCSDDASFFSDNYFDLLPNFKKRVECTTSLDPDTFRQTLKIISLCDSY